MRAECGRLVSRSRGVSSVILSSTVASLGRRPGVASCAATLRCRSPLAGAPPDVLADVLGAPLERPQWRPVLDSEEPTRRARGLPAVHQSTDPTGPDLIYTAQEMDVFGTGVKNGLADHLTTD